MKITSSLAVIAATTLALAAGPALATGASHTVSVGGTPVPAGSSVSFTAATPTTGTNVVLSSGWSCASATASGTIQPGIDIASIGFITWTGCSGPGGTYNVTAVASWPFHSSTAASASAAEVIPGHVDNIEMIWVNAARPGICMFRVRGVGAAKGLATASFNESTQQLVIAETGLTGNLRAQNVTGCGGQLYSGKPVDLSMAMTVTAAGGALNSTS